MEVAKDLIEDVIDNALSFIENEQLVDGGFESLSSVDPYGFSVSKKYRTVFFPAVVGMVLGRLKHQEKVQSILEKIVTFLLKEKSNEWTWNYWSRNTEQFELLRYPDDLDDTACALIALTLHDPNLITGQGWAKIAQNLINVEIRPGGPYRTWFVPEKFSERWRDIDIAVNCNVAYLMRLHQIKLPGLHQYILDIFKSGVLESRYYYSSLPVLYFLSQSYLEFDRDVLIEILNFQIKINPEGKSLLADSLLAASAINFGCSNLVQDRIKNIIEYSLKAQWDVEGFCMDPDLDGVKRYAGSQALTAALCVGVLDQVISTSTPEAIESQEGRYIHDIILSSVNSEIAAMPHYIQEGMSLALDQVLNKNKNLMITLLSFHFRSGLRSELKSKVPEGLIVDLGKANLFGWISYSVFDDFFDYEGDVKNLSAGVVFNRKMIEVFEGISLDIKVFKDLYIKTLDDCDAANAWEVSSARSIQDIPTYGNYSVLAEKSLGHALGPLAILLYLGYFPGSEEFNHTLKFFKHYIIAKQLNDDAHDWREDLSKGRVSSVCALLLKRFLDQNPNTEYSESYIQQLEEIFAYHTIDLVIAEIGKNLDLARHNLEHIQVLEDKSIFLEMLNRLATGSELALQTAVKAREFLQEYKN
jgi:hypothetical protein